MADRYEASWRWSYQQVGRAGFVMAYLVVGEAMQQPARLDFFQLFHDIAVAAARRGGHNVLVEGPWDEDDEDKEIHHGADGAHGLWAGSCEQSCLIRKVT